MMGEYKGAYIVILLLLWGCVVPPPGQVERPSPQPRLPDFVDIGLHGVSERYISLHIPEEYQGLALVRPGWDYVGPQLQFTFLNRGEGFQFSYAQSVTFHTEQGEINLQTQDVQERLARHDHAPGLWYKEKKVLLLQEENLPIILCSKPLSFKYGGYTFGVPSEVQELLEQLAHVRPWAKD